MQPTRHQALAVLVSLGSICVTACAQTLAELTDVLAAAATVDDPAVGIDGSKSPTYRAYERWRSLATQQQLREFTAHQSPNVRAYAVLALVATGAECDWKALVMERLFDVAEVTRFEGCCQSKQKVGDVCFTAVRGKLSDDEVLDLAGVMLQKDCPLYAREWALRTLRFRDGMLHVVRRLAKAGDGPAAIALARYGLAPDVPILIQHLQASDPFDRNTQFLAAAIHRDAQLLAPLIAIEGAARKRIAEDNPSRLRFWLQAIAAQDSAEAASCLLRFLRTTRPEAPFKERDLLDTFEAVLAEHPANAAFDGVREELTSRKAAARR
jgi:hypothetical protein